MVSRRRFLGGIGAAAACLALPSWPARAQGVIGALQGELASGRACGSEEAALRGTIARLSGISAPTRGVSVVVDIPSQHLAAYDNGDVVLESRVVVGNPDWKTPDLDTRISYVRFNPTWTVPESIIEARSWRSRLVRDSAYFENLDFRIGVNGAMVSPGEAARAGGRVGPFVQQPGRSNALGRVKLGLQAGGAIYLHDTNDHSAFDEDSRALSHGCIRVEEAVALAGWVLGIETAEAERLVRDGDRRDRTNMPSPVRLVTTYCTAWPDASGVIRYYPDVYGRDGAGSACRDGRVSGVERAPYREVGGYGAPADVIILRE